MKAKKPQKIIPCLWYDKEAEEAVKFYTSIFNGKYQEDPPRYDELSSEVSGMPKGTVLTIEFELEGQKFLAMNGGPMFNFSPAVSFFVGCETEEELNQKWNKLSEGGKVLMPLDTYPFNKLYGWVEDKYGLSWQLSLEKREQKITPHFLFAGNQHGRSEAAMHYYTALFESSAVLSIDYYDEQDTPKGEVKGTVKLAVFSLIEQEFMITDSHLNHKFDITPAISFIVNCNSQQEIDQHWENLSEGGEKQMCGWVLDQYGISWQVVPEKLSEMMKSEDKEAVKRLEKELYEMKKIELEQLEKAFGEEVVGK